MKRFILLQGRALRPCLFLVTAAVLLSATPSKAATWGDTDDSFFSYFGFTQDWTALDVGTNPVTLTDLAAIAGNFGVAGATTGSTQLTITDYAAVNNLFLNSHATIHETTDNTAFINSTTHTNLNADITATTTAANYFKGLPNSSTSTWSSSNSSLSSKLTLGPTKGLLNLNGSSQDLTLTAKGTTPVVFNISTFNLNNGAELTLSGSANSEFVFNIYGGQFNVNASEITLTGGLLPSDVVYDYVGTSGSGPQVMNKAVVTGIVLASQKTVTIQNQAAVVGSVISNGLNIQQAGAVASIESADY